MRSLLTLITGLTLLLSVSARAEDAASAPAPGAAASRPEDVSSAADEPSGAGNLVAPGSQTEAGIFYVVGGAAALCALGCVFSTNIVRMATFLFGALGAVAVLYFLMAANFLGAIQLIVYAGGTLIVIIFGVMLTSKSPWVRFAPTRTEVVAGGIVCGLLFVGMVALLSQAVWPQGTSAPAGFTVEQIGRSLLTTYLVPFELASVLLLAVMIGAAYLARVEKR